MAAATKRKYIDGLFSSHVTAAELTVDNCATCVAARSHMVHTCTLMVIGRMVIGQIKTTNTDRFATFALYLQIGLSSSTPVRPPTCQNKKEIDSGSFWNRDERKHGLISFVALTLPAFPSRPQS
jgi:hypothetical protein